MTEAAGGVMYAIPPSELPELLALLHRGTAWASTNGMGASPVMVARIRDLEVLTAALRPMNRESRADVVNGVVSDVVAPLHERRLAEVERHHLSGVAEYGLAEFAALAGVTRQAVLGRINRGTLPARKDERGRWRVTIEAEQAQRGA
jgi:hypothetical protein